MKCAISRCFEPPQRQRAKQVLQHECMQENNRLGDSSTEAHESKAVRSFPMSLRIRNRSGFSRGGAKIAEARSILRDPLSQYSAFWRRIRRARPWSRPVFALRVPIRPQQAEALRLNKMFLFSLVAAPPLQALRVKKCNSSAFSASPRENGSNSFFHFQRGPLISGLLQIINIQRIVNKSSRK